MTHKSRFLEKVFGVFLLAGFFTFVAPYWHPSNFASFAAMFAIVAVVAWTFAKFFSGEGGRRYLILTAVVILISLLLYAMTPIFH